jgi:hypothetical protein
VLVEQRFVSQINQKTGNNLVHLKSLPISFSLPANRKITEGSTSKSLGWISVGIIINPKIHDDWWYDMWLNCTLTKNERTKKDIIAGINNHQITMRQDNTFNLTSAPGRADGIIMNSDVYALWCSLDSKQPHVTTNLWVPSTSQNFRPVTRSILKSITES